MRRFTNRTRSPETEKQLDPAKLLEKAAELYRSREILYGHAHKRPGKILSALFPNGILLITEEEFSRFHTLTLCLVKLARYAHNLKSGGHLDSARDLQAYAAILESKTNEE